MKLVRYGAKGAEKPGLIDKSGQLRDLSAEIRDLDGEAYAPASLAKLAALDTSKLPAVDGKQRFGAPVTGISKFVAIGLNYSDHAKETGSQILSMRLSPDEEFGHKVTKVSVRQDCFEGGIEAIPWEQRKPYDEFDYGYVLTVHKSQGSQWDDVVLFDESFAFQDSRARWLYTGITRAAKRLSIVV